MLGLWISHSVEFRARSSKPQRFSPCVAEGTQTELALSHPGSGNLRFQKSGSFTSYVAPVDQMAHLLKLGQNV